MGKYEPLEIEVIEFVTGDLITTSQEPAEDPETPEVPF